MKNDDLCKTQMVEKKLTKKEKKWEGAKKETHWCTNVPENRSKYIVNNNKYKVEFTHFRSRKGKK